MKKRFTKKSPFRFRYVVPAIAILGVLGIVLVDQFESRPELALSQLSEQTHFHGIAVDPTNPARIFLATHNGLYVVSPDGKAQQLSRSKDDYMGFTPHPTDASLLYASGHPPGGGNLGFLASTDGGKSWTKLSNGVGGPVDFHQMDVSKADPRTIYGVFRALQVSTDGGHSWEEIGSVPGGLIALGASAKDVDTLYGATRRGLLRSTDRGRTWQNAYDGEQPATMVATTHNGLVYAFIVGTGLIRAVEHDLKWQTINNGFGSDHVLHLAADPSDDRTVYAVTLNPISHAQRVLISRDGGQSWAPLGRDAKQL